MPGAKSRFKPLSAGDSSGSSASHDEGSQLELHLQRQLEEDVARIFDESIYSDLEVVCGKLKILTHSCILKARTHKFYHKLEAILHVNIGRNTFDEIYSFISDVYTECNIHQQEKEIIKYLNENLNLVNNVAIINNPNNKPEEKDEADVYSTPNCVSPEERAIKKAPSSSPSTELTKEYYALVPIEGNILDKELIEQDALSNAFQSINKSQIDLNDKQNKQCVKPTSLFLNSSHISNTKKHSKSCDILRDSDLKIADFIKNIDSNENKTNNATSQIRNNIKKSVTDNKTVDILFKKSNLTETCVDKVLDPTYSPDSLVTDDPSSSSDYLSAAYAVSPGAVSSSGFSQLNVGENATKMENIITVSDSGLENTGMPESLNSNKDVTLTDVSLTESTFHDMVNDDANWQDSTSSTLDKSHIRKIKRSTSLNSPISGTSTGKVLKEERHNKRSLTEMSGTSTKEEKQRQNEEIVILESSSLSSETGSWESVFPPKLGERELCEKFITSERHNALVEEPGRPHQTPNIQHEPHDELCPSLVQKSPFKSRSCFIDAATLVDEDEGKEGTRPIKILPESSRAVSNAAKRDQSPNDWSEGNDNEHDDSLEQEDHRDPDSIQKDLSPTIFDMTPITEDSLCGNTFETVNDVNQKHPTADSNIDAKNPGDCLANIEISTSNNFTAAGGGYDYNVHASEISGNDTKSIRRDNNAHTPLFDVCSRVSHTPQETFVDGDKVLLKSYESSTISAASVEDRFSQLGNNHSPLVKRTIENIPVVMSGAFIADAKESSITGNRFETVTEEQIPSRAPCDSNTEINNKKSGDPLALQNIATSTPNNSIISVAGGGSDYKTYPSEIGENDIIKSTRRDNNSHTPLFDLCSNVNAQENFVNKDCNKVFFTNNDSPIISGGASVEDHLPQLGNSYRGSPLTKRKIENIPIVSGAYIIPEPKEIIEKTVKTSVDSFWVVDMSSTSTTPNPNVLAPNNELVVDKATAALRASSKSKNRDVSTSSFENCKSRSSVDSDSSEKSTHKFYIDLATLPDTLTPEKKHDVDDNNEKKNIFSMFIDLGNKAATVKEMPPRLSSSLNTKKSSKLEIKRTTAKGSKTTKTSSLTSVTNFNNTDDSLLFEKLESLCNDPSISISEIISNPESHTEDTTEFSESVTANDLMKTTIEQEPDYDESMDLFVKLSDLDKPIPKVEAPMLSTKNESNERMTRSIPDNDWRESNQTINTRSSEIISSFHSENALSLNRLFPHLKNDFSRSMPGYLSSHIRSPLRLGMSSNAGDFDEQASDVSEMSSVQSSYCRSVVENSTTEETDQTSSLISNCQSRLGQDLLRMFLEEIAPDVIVEAAGRRIKAHKCILSSRCQYFAGILSGGWVESAGNVIALPPFSFNVVHFALCHIYSGVSMIPDSISIVELATIADMLGLEGLKEAIMFTLKSKYCHHFHKPCTVCTAGALECFPLSSVYGLDDLYRKCLRWITKHFHKVWPTKAFATLPSELLDKCYQEHIVNLSTDNVVETVYGCGITVASLQNSRWCDTVARMCRRLENAAAHFAAPRLGAVLRATATLPADAAPPAAQALDDCMAAAIEWAPPDEACRAYAFLSVLVRELRARHHAKPDLISSGAQPEAAVPDSLLHSRAPGWRLQCEGALVRAAPRVVGTQAFKDLPADLRKRLRELGCIMFGTQAIPVSPSPLMHRKTRSAHCGRPGARAHHTAASRSLDIDRVRASFVPYTPKPPPQVGSVDLLPVRDARGPKPNKTLPPSVRTTKAQEERAKYNMTKTNRSQDRLNCKPTARAVFENAKPRYLEPRPPKEEKRAPLKKPQPKMVSSSESSRNSSPNQVRRAPPRAAASRDSLAASRPRTADPSTDSLSESQNSNKYATYTKVKHTTKGSVESVTIQPSKCQLLSISINNKAKATKIPVFVKQNSNSKTRIAVSITSREVQRRAQADKSVASSLSPVAQPRNRANERKPSGSLMNATKSSQAKMVPKIVKETHNTKCSNRPDKHIKCSKHPSPLSPPAQEIPIMERSGTFLKDEPMFGDKTTNIDIDE